MKKGFGDIAALILISYSDQIDLYFENYFCNIFDNLVKITKIELLGFFSVLYVFV